MTREELAAAYPGCPNAVAFCELPEIVEGWEASRRSGESPSRVAGFCRSELARAIGAAPREAGSRHAAASLALAEMGHPDFLRYVAGKLGAA